MSKTQDTDMQTWTVRIMDHSGALEDDIVENISPFYDLDHANAFARAYVRDSVERGRTRNAPARNVLEAWYTFGENAVIVDAGDDGWNAATEIEDFAANPATPMERDWRTLDPRRLISEDGSDLLPEGEGPS